MDITTPATLLSGPIAQSPLASAAAPSRGPASADFQSFLTLLTAQMKNQDPLSPLNSTEFIAQLASFSSVEQLVGVNTRLDELARGAGARGIAGIAGWIGHDAATGDGSFRTTGGPAGFIVPATAPGETVEAVIRTPAGTVLRRFAVFSDAHGRALWDGRDANGSPVAAQDLALDLNVMKGGETVRTVPGEVLVRITGLSGGDGGVSIDLSDGRSVAPETLTRLQEPAG